MQPDLLFSENRKKNYYEKIEKEKYNKVWLLEDRAYANFSPGLFISEHFDFMKTFKMNNVKTILDAGMGSGKLFKKMTGLGFLCHGVDIAVNCLDDDLMELKDEILTVGTLWDSSLFREKQFDAIVCTDVLEHIPTEYIKDVLYSFHKWCGKYLFLQISLTEDIFGGKVGHPLHLTVRPKSWWDSQLGQFKTIEYKNVVDRNGDDIWAIYLLENTPFSRR